MYAYLWQEICCLKHSISKLHVRLVMYMCPRLCIHVGLVKNVRVSTFASTGVYTHPHICSYHCPMHWCLGLCVENIPGYRRLYMVIRGYTCL